MERYGQVVLLAIPFFLVLILFEKFYGLWKGQDRTPMLDMLTGVQSGLTNAVKDVLGLSISILSYDWMVSHLALTEIKAGWYVYAIAFIVLDFQGYWVHRWAHEINFFWNKHAIHHSSEEYNLAVALRQSVSSFINLFTFFLLPCALLGIPSLVIATIAPIHLFAQFWYHTRHIRKMGLLEQLIVTPSHHRVHHAINKEYMDKNYSQIFIFWDKWFGTFQPELPDVEPVYGITRPAQTWNPIKINFQHFFLMLRDAWFTQRWWDKLRLWWMPTGWRPADVTARFPIHKIEDVFHFEKYNSHLSQVLRLWVVIQTIIILLMGAHFFGSISAIGSPGIFWYGLFIFISVYSVTELMDGHRWAWIYEAVRVAFGFYFLYTQKDWFALEQVFPGVGIVVAIYLLVTFLGVCYFQFFEVNKKAVIQ